MTQKTGLTNCFASGVCFHSLNEGEIIPLQTWAPPSTRPALPLALWALGIIDLVSGGVLSAQE